MVSPLVFAALFAAAPAVETLANVQRLVVEARFEEARQSASRLLQSGSAGDPGQTAELHSLIAQTSAALGDLVEAERSFARALELAPGLQLPVGTSPKLTVPFEAARKGLEGRTLSVTPSGRRLGEHAIITVKISGDPLHLVARGSVTSAEGVVPLAPTDPPQASISCPAPRCTYRLTLFDVHGNPLLQAGSEASPLVLPEVVPSRESPAPGVASVTDTKAWFQRPWPYWLVAGAGALGAGLLGWQTSVADANARATLATPRERTFAELQGQISTRDTLFVSTLGVATLAVTAAIIGAVVW
ncbi:MAG: tetratricopeptide repeat protein [Myxococcales bacterium]|nr:tetratricopeptide repeat protein [Myxococcales bacterium]